MTTTCDINKAITTANKQRETAARRRAAKDEAREASLRKARQLARLGGLKSGRPLRIAAAAIFVAAAASVFVGAHLGDTAGIPALPALIALFALFLGGAFSALALGETASDRDAVIQVLAKLIRHGCDDEQVVELAARTSAGQADPIATANVVLAADAHPG